MCRFMSGVSREIWSRMRSISNSGEICRSTTVRAFFQAVLMLPDQTKLVRARAPAAPIPMRKSFLNMRWTPLAVALIRGFCRPVAGEMTNATRGISMAVGKYLQKWKKNGDQGFLPISRSRS